MHTDKRKHALVILLLSLVLPAAASDTSKIAESSERIYQMQDGLIIVPVQDEVDRLLRPDLRNPPVADQNLPQSFQPGFFKRSGLSTYPYFWIFLPSDGKALKVQTNKLTIKSHSWGESSGSLENVLVSAGVEDVLPSNGVAIFSSEMPFKDKPYSSINFSGAPPSITSQSFGIKESDYKAVRIKYSKRLSGTEIAVLLTYKKYDSQVRCGEGGIATKKTVFVRTGDLWQEAYSKFGEMDPENLNEEHLSTNSPLAVTGASRRGGEVIFIDDVFIVIENGKASLIPIQTPNNGTCGC